MKYQELIRQSEAYLAMEPGYNAGEIPHSMFAAGAEWMCVKLNEIDPARKTAYDPAINFTYFGMLKYGISLAAFVIAVFLLYQVNIYLVPLAVVVFYLFEIQFLFLFPLLIDKVPQPVWASLRQTYRVGILKALFTVLPIGFYMVLGLLNLRNPLENWYTGCMAILIWYKDDVRNRV